MNLKQYTKPLMVGGIGAIGGAGFLATLLVLVGGFNDFTGKALATTLVIGYYSLTTVSTFGEGKVFGFLAACGVAIAGLGLFLTIPEIWFSNFLTGSEKWKLILSCAAVAFGLGYASINLRVAGITPAGVGTMVGANFCVGVVTCMMVYLIQNEGRDIGESFVRMLIGLTIAGLTLSLINWIVGKMSRQSAQ